MKRHLSTVSSGATLGFGGSRPRVVRALRASKSAEKKSRAGSLIGSGGGGGSSVGGGGGGSGQGSGGGGGNGSSSLASALSLLLTLALCLLLWPS